MALGDFFRINMPYGMERNDKNEWFVFNREYKPLGFNTNSHIEYENHPVFVKYKGLTEKKLQKLACFEDGYTPLVQVFPINPQAATLVQFKFMGLLFLV